MLASTIKRHQAELKLDWSDVSSQPSNWKTIQTIAR
jgi:hypothetical protein